MHLAVVFEFLHTVPEVIRKPLAALTLAALLLAAAPVSLAAELAVGSSAVQPSPSMDGGGTFLGGPVPSGTGTIAPSFLPLSLDGFSHSVRTDSLASEISAATSWATRADDAAHEAAVARKVAAGWSAFTAMRSDISRHRTGLVAKAMYENGGEDFILLTELINGSDIATAAHDALTTRVLAGQYSGRAAQEIAIADEASAALEIKDDLLRTTAMADVTARIWLASLLTLDGMLADSNFDALAVRPFVEMLERQMPRLVRDEFAQLTGDVFTISDHHRASAALPVTVDPTSVSGTTVPVPSAVSWDIALSGEKVDIDKIRSALPEGTDVWVVPFLTVKASNSNERRDSKGRTSTRVLTRTVDVFGLTLPAASAQEPLTTRDGELLAPSRLASTSVSSEIVAASVSLASMLNLFPGQELLLTTLAQRTAALPSTTPNKTPALPPTTSALSTPVLTTTGTSVSPPPVSPPGSLSVTEVTASAFGSSAIIVGAERFATISASLGVSPRYRIYIDVPLSSSGALTLAALRATAPSFGLTVVDTSPAPAPDRFMSPDDGEAELGPMPFTVANSSGSLNLPSSFTATQLGTINLPVLGPTRCSTKIAPQLIGALTQAALLGYTSALDRSQFGGCTNPRLIPGSGTPSMHARGLAIDLSVPQNLQNSFGQLDPSLVLIFKLWGFRWGGDWVAIDPMHFEAAALLQR